MRLAGCCGLLEVTRSSVSPSVVTMLGIQSEGYLEHRASVDRSAPRLEEPTSPQVIDVLSTLFVDAS